MIQIEINLPFDLLWVDVDENEYLADSTDELFSFRLYDRLAAKGYEANINFGNMMGISIYDAEGNRIEDDNYSIIREIIDSTPVEYIKDDEEWGLIY